MAVAAARKSLSEIMVYDQAVNGGQGAHRVKTMKAKGGTKMPAKAGNK